MSRNTNNVKKPYCKVCYDAGKSEREYTNHWVKDLNGKTTCPTLLNTECRYCHNFGHTAKFCDVLAIRKKDTRWEHPHNEVVHKEQPQTNYRRSQNSFAVLCDNDVSNEKVSSNTIINDSEPLKNSWASIAAKPKKMIPVTKPGVVTLTGCGVKASEPTSKAQVAEMEAPLLSNQNTFQQAREIGLIGLKAKMKTKTKRKMTSIIQTTINLIDGKK